MMSDDCLGIPINVNIFNEFSQTRFGFMPFSTAREVLGFSACESGKGRA